ncbi:hypothetical protein ACXR0O_26430 [Verrucomicrobiota bacterium sgz303538]
MSETDSAFRQRSRLFWYLFAVGVFVFFGLILPLVRRRNPPAAYRAVAARYYANQLVLAMKAYYDEFGSVPIGSNAEIMRTLFGYNPRKITFFEISSPWVSPGGELVDPWGMPYCIDISDPTKLRIYSFGPNKRDEGGIEQSDDVVSWR